MSSVIPRRDPRTGVPKRRRSSTRPCQCRREWMEKEHQRRASCPCTSIVFQPSHQTTTSERANGPVFYIIEITCSNESPSTKGSVSLGVIPDGVQRHDDVASRVAVFGISFLTRSRQRAVTSRWMTCRGPSTNKERAFFACKSGWTCESTTHVPNGK